MSALHIILDRLPSLCQKLSNLVDVWRSYNKNNFACFLLRHGVDRNTLIKLVWLFAVILFLSFILRKGSWKKWGLKGLKALEPKKWGGGSSLAALYKFMPMKIFIKDKTKVACRMSGIEWRVVYLSDVTSAPSLHTFGKRPKPHLFRLSYCGLVS